MIASIAFHPVVVTSCAVLMFLPWNLYLRIGLIFLISFAFLIVPLSIGNGDDFGFAFLIFLAVLCAIIWIAAGVAQYVLRRIITGAPPQFRHSRFDVLFVWAGYVLLALCLFLFAASRFAGTEHAILIHVGMIAIALASLRELAFAITLILLTGYSLSYPMTVRHAAEQAAGGKAYCIYLNQRKSFANTWTDLTFVTFDKGRWSGHAFVVVNNSPEDMAHWSYHARAFIRDSDRSYPARDLRCPTD